MGDFEENLLIRFRSVTEEKAFQLVSLIAFTTHTHGEYFSTAATYKN